MIKVSTEEASEISLPCFLISKTSGMVVFALQYTCLPDTFRGLVIKLQPLIKDGDMHHFELGGIYDEFDIFKFEKYGGKVVLENS